MREQLVAAGAAALVLSATLHIVAWPGAASLAIIAFAVLLLAQQKTVDSARIGFRLRSPTAASRAPVVVAGFTAPGYESCRAKLEQIMSLGLEVRPPMSFSTEQWQLCATRLSQPPPSLHTMPL